MSILAVDTGINNFGLSIFRRTTGVIRHVETIRTKKKKYKGSIAADNIHKICLIAKRLDFLIKKYKVIGLVGEMPSFGAQSSTAAISLTAGASIILTLKEAHSLPAIWKSPREVKEGFTGDPNAPKTKIMRACCDLYKWDMVDKTIRCRKTKKVIRIDTVYHVMGRKMGSNEFEHIADSIAAYYSCLNRK